MATSNETQTKQLPKFSKVRPHEQLAIILRSQKVSAKNIVTQINGEFQLNYRPTTIYEWFMTGGRLEVAYNDYNEQVAQDSVRLAKLRLMQASLKAADTLTELLNEKYPANVRMRAAEILLKKTIPDGNIKSDSGKPFGDNELPLYILDAADEILGLPLQSNFHTVKLN